MNYNDSVAKYPCPRMYYPSSSTYLNTLNCGQRPYNVSGYVPCNLKNVSKYQNISKPIIPDYNRVIETQKARDFILYQLTTGIYDIQGNFHENVNEYDNRVSK
jgi:hypothetical protein